MSSICNQESQFENEELLCFQKISVRDTAQTINFIGKIFENEATSIVQFREELGKPANARQPHDGIFK